jgi:hypothetical protein
MKIEAEDIIFEYLSFYAEFCIEIIIDDYFTDSNHSSQENYDENTSEDEQNLSEDELHIQDSIRSFEKYSGENEQGENDEFSLIMDQLIGSSYLINKTEGLYDRIIANGGSGFDFALEGCPNQERYGCIEYSDTYDFHMFEIYPDRIVTIERFSYIPETGNFMLYVAEEDTYISFPEE